MRKGRACPDNRRGRPETRAGRPRITADIRRSKKNGVMPSLITRPSDMTGGSDGPTVDLRDRLR
jgi:hypothetical protein